jgi:hypothetical protein
MKSRIIIIATFALNLLVGNLIVAGFHGKYETILGKIAIHSIATLIAISVLVLLFKRFAVKTRMPKIILFSMVGSFLVPVLSIFTLFAGYGTFDLRFDSIPKGLYMAFIVGIVGWPFWLPFGIVNSVFFTLYSRQQASS